MQLSPRQWQYIDALRARKTPEQIAVDWGTSRQRVDNIRRELEQLGMIRRRQDLPWTQRYSSEQYPLEVVDDRLPPRSTIPEKVLLRPIYPTVGKGNLTVTPTMLVHWPEKDWSVQAVPTVHPRGLSPTHTAPTDTRLVWCLRMTDGASWVFPARVGARWLETYTVEEFQQRPAAKYRLELTVELRQQLTEMIATALEVDPVMDISPAKWWERHPTPGRGVPTWKPGDPVDFQDPADDQ